MANSQMKRPTDPFHRFTKWVGSVQSVIVHTLLFALSFTIAAIGLAEWDTVLLLVTTIVSLEAIYLAIFIQMSVNRAQESLSEVEEDVAEIEKDIDSIEEDIDEMQEDIEELGEEEDEEHKSIHKQEVTLEAISGTLQKLIADIETLKK